MDPFVTESVPFRLTRNIVNVITPQGIVGPVAASMISAPRALFNYYDLMLSYLSVFFRDDVAAFLFSKNGGAASSSQNSAGALDPSTAAVSGAAATALAAGVQDANLLQRRIISNVVKVLDRMYEMQTSAMGPAAAAIPPQWSPTGPADVLRSKIYNFITMALNDKKLAQSQLAWMPWM
jgi:phosphatidylinositol kinase/protein kinase (PI-3  family)